MCARTRVFPPTSVHGPLRRRLFELDESGLIATEMAPYYVQRRGQHSIAQIRATLTAGCRTGLVNTI